jgi:hypothetical protein
MLSCIRKAMIHFDIFFRSKIPDADRRPPSDVRWLAAGLAMSPNIEVLHIVLFCIKMVVHQGYRSALGLRPRRVARVL